MCLVLLEVTSVQVKGHDAQLEVSGGDFNITAMATKIKDIDESVSVIIMAEPNVHAPKNEASYSTNSKTNNALSAFCRGQSVNDQQ